MLFLVFFQFGALDVDDLDLAVEVLFNGFVVLDLLFEILVFLIEDCSFCLMRFSDSEIF